MKKMLTAIVWITGFYCFGHLLFNFNSTEPVLMLGETMQITTTMVTWVVELVFSVSLLIYLFKYTEKSPTKNCHTKRI